MWRFLALVFLVLICVVFVMWSIGVWPFDTAAATSNGKAGENANTVLKATDVIYARRDNQETAPPRAFSESRQRFADAIPIHGATINMIEEQEVSSRVDGQIREIAVEEDQPVHRGDILVRLDDSLAQDEENIQRLKAESEQAVKAAYFKYQTTARIVEDDIRALSAVSENDKLIHRFQRDTALEEWKKAIEDREIAKRELIKVQRQREMHLIRSGVSGRVTRVYKQPGEMVKAGEPICRVANHDRLRLEGAVDVQHKDSLQEGMRVLVEPERPIFPVKQLPGHTGPITSLTVTPDGEFIASASEDSTIRLWDSFSGSSKYVLIDKSNPTDVFAVAAGPTQRSADGSELTYIFLAGYADARARLWFVQMKVQDDARGRRSTPAKTVIGHREMDLKNPSEAHRTGAVRAVAISFDGRLCATGGDDRQICIWELDGETPRLLYRVRERENEYDTAHRGAVTTLRFTEGDDHAIYLISAATDKTVKKWKLGRSNAELAGSLTGRTGDVKQIGVSSDGKRVLFEAGSQLRIYDIDTESILGTIQGSGQTHFAGLALFAPSDQMVLSENANGRLQLWTVPTPPEDAEWFRRAQMHGFSRNTPFYFGMLGSPALLTLQPYLGWLPWLATARPQPSEPPAPETASLVPGLSPAAHLQFPIVLVDAREYRGLSTVPELWPLNAYEIRHLVTPDAAPTTCAAFGPAMRGASSLDLFTGGRDGTVRIWSVPTADQRGDRREAIITSVSEQVESGTGLIRIRAELDNPSGKAWRIIPNYRVNLTVYPESAAKR